MLRGKQIIYIAHCVLNQNSVIRDWERAQGAFNSIIKVIMDNNISLVQLPCPEFIELGESRPPMTKEEYDIPSYRLTCQRLSNNIIKQMKEYIKYDYKIIALLGIQESPSCDTLGKTGIFMEELLKQASGENINIDLYDIPEAYIEGESNEIVDDFKRFLQGKLKGII